MKERPILFSAPMVLALRSDRKTQTRRTRGLDKINESPDEWRYQGFVQWDGMKEPGHVFCTDRKVPDNKAQCSAIRRPYGVPGDRLWTRETLKRPDGDPWLYAADKEPVMVSAEHETEMLVWAHHKQQDHCVSIHMPRWASRDTLEVVSVRPERLQAITEEDAKAEGCIAGHMIELSASGVTWNARGNFRSLWGDINGPGSWAKNPWVWRVEFRRVSATQEPGESAGSLSDQEGKNAK